VEDRIIGLTRLDAERAMAFSEAKCVDTLPAALAPGCKGSEAAAAVTPQRRAARVKSASGGVNDAVTKAPLRCSACIRDALKKIQPSL